MLNHYNNYNNDLANKQPKGSYAASNHNHNGVYQPAGSYASASHTHSITGLQSGYSSETIPGYSGFRIKRTTADGIKEEFGRVSFSRIGFSQQFGNLYYNTSQPYSIPLGYSYSEMYDIHLQAMSGGSLLGTTISSWDSGHIKYWLYCGKASSVDLELSYHVIGK